MLETYSESVDTIPNYVLAGLVLEILLVDI